VGILRNPHEIPDAKSSLFPPFQQKLALFRTMATPIFRFSDRQRLLSICVWTILTIITPARRAIEQTIWRPEIRLEGPPGSSGSAAGHSHAACAMLSDGM
jgi:hypothetical protein